MANTQVQYTDDVLLNGTLETYIILFTNVTPIHLIFKNLFFYDKLFLFLILNDELNQIIVVSADWGGIWPVSSKASKYLEHGDIMNFKSGMERVVFFQMQRWLRKENIISDISFTIRY